ncbi:MAG: phenylalanine--tRNA ligase subunit alpha [Caldisericia bacterium]|nr:phenylalanine--tRNA ligase subunit alpha [Caldisericia bacterium]
MDVKKDEILNELFADLDKIETLEDLEKVRVKFLGKKGIIKNLTEKFKTIVDFEEKRKYGELINILKNEIELAIEKSKIKILDKLKKLKIQEEKIDETLPGYPYNLGKRHILKIVENEIIDIFMRMGFHLSFGPEIENEYYNFEALNIPKYHPSRDMWDTFYLPNGLLLRTHTSPVQIRTMEKIKPPLRIISPGRCFRRDPFDASHSPIFHQVEGLMIDKNISLADLMGIIDLFAKKMFGEKTQTKFYISYFPFVEPGLEVAATCSLCYGRGCSVCKYTGYVEILGAGMVHPDVLKNVDIDPEEWQGFAFGLGVERVAMIKFGISDIRYFYENDLRFLNEF